MALVFKLIYSLTEWLRFSFQQGTVLQTAAVLCVLTGPVIRGEPGDVIEVTFQNKADHNFSMQPQGVSYDKAYEGVLYEDGKMYKALLDLKVYDMQLDIYLDMN